ncbi:hypothetical protein BCR36DRAFT_45308 [Piromyces finnis]|uniref:Uncharacterized protein n=1 Tax=Piromyces finnis TaxID=1754191 RepID=A0A1Y1VA96_9FUNG|nr:hypothetical protein BCR36DRAFT_45308 [Piromyces finnis]|eukprot:ORX51087.1 hypothetical protein BCR36DRAFT_45308 [Piromyces finnis]
MLFNKSDYNEYKSPLFKNSNYNSIKLMNNKLFPKSKFNITETYNNIEDGQSYSHIQDDISKINLESKINRSIENILIDENLTKLQNKNQKYKSIVTNKTLSSASSISTESIYDYPNLKSYHKKNFGKTYSTFLNENLLSESSLISSASSLLSNETSTSITDILYSNQKNSFDFLFNNQPNNNELISYIKSKKKESHNINSATKATGKSKKKVIKNGIDNNSLNRHVEASLIEDLSIQGNK